MKCPYCDSASIAFSPFQWIQSKRYGVQCPVCWRWVTSRIVEPGVNDIEARQDIVNVLEGTKTPGLQTYSEPSQCPCCGRSD